MQEITNQILTGERAAFASHDVRFVQCVFEDGESPIKESSDIEALNCSFRFRYPLWYSKNILVKDSEFTETERAGIWYTENLTLEHCQIDGVKNFRRCRKVTLHDCILTKAEETFWSCEEIILERCKIEGAPYIFCGSKKVIVRDCEIDGNYAFDTCEDVEIENCVIHTKDAFWNCKRVKARNSTIYSQYIGWNSEDVTFEHCHIESNQGFCYMKRITLKDCELDHTDLCFEYCEDVDAEVTTIIDSVKNPYSGRIKAKGIKELILDPNAGIDPKKTEIITL